MGLFFNFPMKASFCSMVTHGITADSDCHLSFASFIVLCFFYSQELFYLQAGSVTDM